MTNPLKKRLIDQVRREGPITFASFMDAALYDPAGGYYTASPDRVGMRGDYITSPALSPVFGRTLARLVMKVDELLGRPDPFTLLEPGAGTGQTAAQIIDAINRHRPELGQRMRYMALERGDKQRQELRNKYGEMHGLDIIDNLEEINRFEGMIFSNEFFDALPVHRLVMRGGELKEIFVGEEDGSFVDVEGEPSGAGLSEWFDAVGVDLLDGQYADVSIEWMRWMEALGEKLDRGVVATIDYGFPAYELYAPVRSCGTLMAYRGHRACDDLYADPGEQDLTAHVDFTALAISGRRAGLQTLGLTDQLRLFLELGVHEVFAQLEAESSSLAEYQVAVQPAKALVMPGGMGETFKVLGQQAGLDTGALDEISSIFKPKYPLESPDNQVFSFIA